MKISTTERKNYVIFKGTPCEWVGQAMIFGKPYYDIVYNGIRRTVPASMCTKTTEEKNDSNL